MGTRKSRHYSSSECKNANITAVADARMTTRVKVEKQLIVLAMSVVREMEVNCAAARPIRRCIRVDEGRQHDG